MSIILETRLYTNLSLDYRKVITKSSNSKWCNIFETVILLIIVLENNSETILNNRVINLFIA